MGWILVAVILGSLFYAGKTLLEYTNYTLEISPIIARFGNEAGDLEEEADSEAGIRDEINERIPPLKALISDLRKRVSDLRMDAEREEDLNRRLQIQVIKKEIKSKRNA